MNLRLMFVLAVASPSFLHCIAPAAAQEVKPSRPASPVLPVDTRLDRKVTLDATAVSLGDVLQKLNIGIVLSCDRDSRDLKLQINIKQRSLRVVMESLADLLPGTWEPGDNHGYKLMMRPEAIKQRREWWRLFQEQRERAVQEMADQLLSAMRAPLTPEQIKQAATAPPGFPSDAVGRMFFHGLPPDLQEKIVHSVNEGLLYSKNSGLTSADEGNAIVVSFRSLPPDAQAVLKRLRPNVSPDFWARFTCNARSVQANFIDIKGRNQVSTLIAHSDGYQPQQLVLGLNHALLAETYRRLQVPMSPSLRRLIAFQDTRVWDNAPPATPRPGRIPPPRRADLLDRLRKQAHLEFIADYYSLEAQPVLQDEPLGPDLDAELNGLAADTDTSWKKHDDLYLLRNNRWYRDDLLEVPAILADKWLAARRTEKPEAPMPLPETPPASSSTEVTVSGGNVKTPPYSKVLANEAEFASNLTRWQLANGLMWLADENYVRSLRDLKLGVGTRLDVHSLYPFYQDAMIVQSTYSLLRFYGSLSAPQQAALLAGKLTLGELNPEQQGLAVSVAPMLQASLESAPPASILLHLGMNSPINGKPTVLFDILPM